SASFRSEIIKDHLCGLPPPPPSGAPPPYDGGGTTSEISTGEIMTLPHKALRSILPVAGWSDDRAADVTFTGGTDPVLPTPFRVGVAGAATVATAGLAAAALWEVRTGRRQSVAVDLRQATASLRSGTYMKLGD